MPDVNIITIKYNSRWKNYVYVSDGETSDWKHLFDLNVIAVATCCRESYKSMKKYGVLDGHIININRLNTYN